MRTERLLLLAAAVACIACGNGNTECSNLFGWACPTSYAERWGVQLQGFPSSQYDAASASTAGSEGWMPSGQRIEVRLTGDGAEHVRWFRCTLTDPAAVRFSPLSATTGTLEASSPGLTEISIELYFKDGSAGHGGLFACGATGIPPAWGCQRVQAIRVTP